MKGREETKKNAASREQQKPRSKKDSARQEINPAKHAPDRKRAAPKGKHV